MSDTLRREHLAHENAERVAEMFRALGLQVASLAERAASLAAFLGDRPEGDVWVFGYGSLMWNPALEIAESRGAKLAGWHRSFCLWNTFGRGSPEKPGLTLALEPGGSCTGVAFRLEAARAQEELAILWNREMLTGAYLPRWVPLVSAQGPVQALTFCANRAHDRYTGRLPRARVAELLASASGPLGRSRDYLERTVTELERLGVRRGTMHALLDAVRAVD
jgi:cation transport protein ChaC